MNDALGDRMKGQYEDRTRYLLPRRTYTILRIDGKAFHTYTRDCVRPFDEALREAMNDAAMALCQEAQGCEFAYVQSDEASFLLTDFSRIETAAWFDGVVQKIASVSASLFTSAFCYARSLQRKNAHASFDCRVFTIPDPTEVENYFIWRNKDAMRNSVQMLAQSLFSQKQLHGKSTGEIEAMCAASGMPWCGQEDWAKYGSVIDERSYETEAFGGEERQMAIRWRWQAEDASVFTENRQWLTDNVRRYPTEERSI